MAITRQKKEEIYNKVTDVVKGAQSIVFVNFHKLSVANSIKLRRSLRGEGVGYTVAKKTLVKRVLTDSKIAGEMPLLEGEIAVAYGTDLIAPAREVYAFQKANKDVVSIVGGVFEGKFMNKEEMMEVATIPGVPVLRGMFVNVINSPIQRFVIALGQIADKKTA